jgi:guanylate kinase
MILIVIGSSGAGKSSILKQIDLERKTTTTTRDIRLEDGEVEGIDYYYISKEKFNQLKEKNGFIETDEFGGEQYGTEVSILENIDTTDISIILTPEGAKSLQTYCKENNIISKTVLLTLPKEKIKERLLKRGDRPEKIKKRLKAEVENPIADKAHILKEKGELIIDLEIPTEKYSMNEVIKQINILIKPYIKEKKTIKKPKKGQKKQKNNFNK